MTGVQTCALPISEFSTGVISGSASFTRSEFANKTIGYYKNGSYFETIADNTGTYSIDTEIGDSLIMGIPFESSLISAAIEEGSKFGQANGLIKRIDRATLYLTKSGACKIGSDNGTLYQV